MGKRFHAPRGATTIAGVARRRTLRGMMDAKINGSADIRPVVYRGPRGTAGAMVTNPGSGQTYYVSNPTGKTFKPGTIVPAGSYSGAAKDFLLLGPPAGPQGASLGGVVRRGGYRTGVAPPASIPTHLGFYVAGFGETSHLVSYIGSEPYELLASTADIAPSSDARWPGGAVFIGGTTLIVLGDDVGSGDYTALYSWDTESNTVTSIAATTDYSIKHCPAAIGSYIYWIEAEIALRNEYPDFKQKVRLMRASPSLSGATMMEEIEAVIQPGVAGSTLGVVLSAFNTSAVVGAVVFGDQDGVRSRRFNFRITTSGSSTTSYTTTPGNDLDNETLSGRGVPAADGDSKIFSNGVAAGGSYDDYVMRSVDDALVVATSEIWSGGSYPSGPPSIDNPTLHVGSDGLMGHLYMDGTLYSALVVAPDSEVATVTPSEIPGIGFPTHFFPIE